MSISCSHVAKVSSSLPHSSWRRKPKYLGCRALHTESVVSRDSSSVGTSGERELVHSEHAQGDASASVPPVPQPVTDVSDKTGSQPDASSIRSEESVESSKSSNQISRMNDDSSPRLNPYLFLEVGSPLQKAGLVALLAALYIFIKESSASGGLPVFDVVFRLIGLWTVLWGLRVVLQAKKDAQR